MSETNKKEQAEGQGLSITSLVLGILAIITSIVWYIGIVFGVLAVIFGTVSIKKLGRKKAITGIVTGCIGIGLSLLIIWMLHAALPALQLSQRDTARRNDVSVLTTNVLDHQTNNQGQLPDVSSLSTAGFAQVVSLTSVGSPTTQTAVYTPGKSCDGASSKRAYSITVLLESGSTYCQGS